MATRQNSIFEEYSKKDNDCYNKEVRDSTTKTQDPSLSSFFTKKNSGKAQRLQSTLH